MRHNADFEAEKAVLGLEGRPPFAIGKRSFVYRIMFHKKDSIVKVERKDIDAVGRISNEVNWLKILNRKGIGPKLLGYGKDFFIAEFAGGIPFPIWLKEAGTDSVKSVLGEIMRQCRQLDKLLVSKEEMHHPYKHIIIGEKVKMIDFERCHSTEKPKNVTQVCQYLTSENISPALVGKGFQIGKDEIQKILKEYKKDYSEKRFREILGLLIPGTRTLRRSSFPC